MKQNLKYANSKENPWFIGIGVHRPHTPFHVPKVARDKYPATPNISAAKNVFVPRNQTNILAHWILYRSSFQVSTEKLDTVGIHCRMGWSNRDCCFTRKRKTQNSFPKWYNVFSRWISKRPSCWLLFCCHIYWWPIWICHAIIRWSGCYRWYTCCCCCRPRLSTWSVFLTVPDCSILLCCFSKIRRTCGMGKTHKLGVGNSSTNDYQSTMEGKVSQQDYHKQQCWIGRFVSYNGIPGWSSRSKISWCLSWPYSYHDLCVWIRFPSGVFQ